MPQRQDTHCGCSDSGVSTHEVLRKTLVARSFDRVNQVHPPFHPAIPPLEQPRPCEPHTDPMAKEMPTLRITSVLT